MKKFKLMGITLLASSVLLSSCMFLLPKKKSSSTNTSDPTSSSQTSEPSSENWSDSILNEMKQYLDGETIPFIKGTWQWAYDDDYGCYSGVSTDTSSKVAIAAFDTSWNKEVDDEGESGNFTRIKTKGVVEVMAYEYENKTYVDGYYVEEFSDWDAETKEEMEDAFGEVIPFPAGTWSALMMDNYGDYLIQSGHSYNYSSMKTLYQNKGYEFFEEEGEEYYYKKLGDYYVIGYFYENTNLKVGYDVFYLDTEPPFEQEFEFSSTKEKALVGEDVEFTVTRGEGVSVDTVQYTVSPTTAATVKSSTNNGAVFTIKEAGTIVFTATQGDLTASYTLTAYTEYPKPTAISFKKTSYNVDQGDKLDLSKEIQIEPAGAEGTITYSVTGNSGVTVSSAGLVTVAQTASTSSDATVTARYSETVYGTCTIKVVEPVSGFNKITNASELVSGKYLIVDETYKVALDGSLDTLDAHNNLISNLTITNGHIDSTTALEAAAFTYDATGKSLQCKTGYIDWTNSSKNGLSVSSTASALTITFTATGDAEIASSSGNLLKFNFKNDDNGYRFRFYKSTSADCELVQLYKLG